MSLTSVGKPTLPDAVAGVLAVKQVETRGGKEGVEPEPKFPATKADVVAWLEERLNGQELSCAIMT